VYIYVFNVSQHSIELSIDVAVVRPVPAAV